MIAADFRMGDSGKHGELIAQIAEYFQVFARLIIRPGFFGEERRAIEAETGADVHDPPRRTSRRLTSPRPGFPTREGQESPRWFG